MYFVYFKYTPHIYFLYEYIILPNFVFRVWKVYLEKRMYIMNTINLVGKAFTM